MNNPIYIIKHPFNIERISKTETINKDYLLYFYKNPDIIQEYNNSIDIKGNVINKIYNIHSIIKSLYLKTKNTNSYQTIYLQSKTSYDTGRFFVEKGQGLQMLSKPIRQSLASGIYRDFDFKNCHPSILLQLSKKNSWLCDPLQYYVDNRDECLNIFMKKTGYSYDYCKQQILKLLNGGSVNLNGYIINQEEDDLKWLFHLQKNIEDIHSKIRKYYPEYEKLAKKKNKISKKDNIDGSTFNMLVCDIENQGLLAFNEFLINNNFEPDVLVFDGLMVKNNDKLDNNILKQAEKYIYEKIDFEFTIIEKPFDKVIPFPENFNDSTIKEEDTYLFQKKKFEKNHFKLMYPPCFVKIDENNELLYYSDKHLNQIYENKTYKKIEINEYGQKYIVNRNFIRNVAMSDGKTGWVVDKNIRTYDKIGFYPPPLICPKNIYNSWNGFEIENKVEKIENLNFETDEHIQMWYVYLSNLFEPTHRDYFIKCLAFVIQFPGLKNFIAVLIKGEQGAGKDLALKILENIIGEKYCFQTSNIEKDVLSRFSVAVPNKIINIFDEIQAKDMYKNVEYIKDMITNENSNYERKGFSSEKIKDLRKIFTTTNNDNTVCIDANDRRWAILEASSYYLGNREFFAKFFKNIATNDIALRKIFQYLQSVDIQNFDFVNNRPFSELKQDMIETNLSLEIKFLRWLCQYPKYKDFEGEFSTNNLFNEYNRFLDFCLIKDKDINYLKFTHRLKRIIINQNINKNYKCITKPDVRSSNSKYEINFKNLRKWFIEKKYLSINDM